LNVKQFLDNAAREGCRQAASGVVDAAGVRQVVLDYLTAAGLPTGIQPVDNMNAYGVIVGPVPGA